jgi:hypothetical protein
MPSAGETVCGMAEVRTQVAAVSDLHIGVNSKTNFKRESHAEFFATEKEISALEIGFMMRFAHRFIRPLKVSRTDCRCWNRPIGDSRIICMFSAKIREGGRSVHRARQFARFFPNEKVTTLV